MSLIGATYPVTAPPPVDAAPTTTVWSTPGRKESGLARVPDLQLVHRVSYFGLMPSDLAPALMRALGFRGEPAPTFRAALYPDDEQRTFRGLKDSARRNVRRAERLGLLVRTEEDESFVDE